MPRLQARSSPTGAHPVIRPSTPWKGFFCGPEIRLRGVLCLLLVLAVPVAAADDLTRIDPHEKPAFSLPDLTGRPVALEDFRGRVLLINFWASWCRPCVQEMPGIRRLRAAMRDRPFEVIGINVGEEAARARTAAHRLDLDFPVLLDRDSRVFGAWGAQILPTSYIVDAFGRVHYRVLGPLEWDAATVVERLRALADGDTPLDEAPRGR